MKMKRKTLYLGLAIIAVLAIVLFTSRPTPKFTIDEDWVILYNSDDIFDSASVMFIQDEYDSELVPFETSPDDTYLNAKGRNLIIIGGSNDLAEQAPWFDPHRPLTITRPTLQPEVYYDNDGTWSNMWIHTPKGNFILSQDGTLLNDLGVITVGHDVQLNRRIIIVVGHSAQCTAAGAKLVIENLDTLIQSHTWLIFELVGGSGTPINDWTPEAFEYSIVESSG